MLWGKGDAALRGGLDAGGESVMPGVPCARAEAVMHSSLRLSWRRKGACGSSLWKQSGDSAAEGRLLGRAPPSSHAVRRPGCHGSQGDPGTGCDRRVAVPSPTPRPTHPTDTAGPIRGRPMVHTCDRGAGDLCWAVEGGLSGIHVFRPLLRNIYGQITSHRQCPQEVNSPAAGG